MDSPTVSAGTNLASDLRRLADIVDINPVLAELLRVNLKSGLNVFPNSFGVDCGSVVESLSDAGLTMTADPTHLPEGWAPSAVATLPAGAIAIHVQPGRSVAAPLEAVA
ncbi:hypothetical protein GCM10007304_18210 [Rhodococcoides trifolii]|uniref:Uncharacterized protein n=1 Tax=Rhodococcoides trifolii TaxID=908250 RepID=A0A917D032_9NOCA|nr:hypothetical protein [Rhodococcus trifolii]GGG04458.1 hypothetical protein GCM10007304_18210 [Rhodococcus trifolii]